MGLIAVFVLAALVGCSDSVQSGSSLNKDFTGLNRHTGNLPLLSDAQTRSISAENLAGEKGKGGMAIPNPDEPSPANCARAADDIASVAYWYQTEPHQPFPKLPTLAERALKRTKPPIAT